MAATRLCNGALLFLMMIEGVASAAELSVQDRETIERAVSNIAKSNSRNLFGEQDAAFQKIDEQFKDNPRVRVWLRQRYYWNVVNPNAGTHNKERLARKNAWLRSLAAWKDAAGFPDDVKARYQVFRLSQCDPSKLCAEAAPWWPLLDATAWDDDEGTYLQIAKNALSEGLKHTRLSEVTRALAQWTAIAERMKDHPKTTVWLPEAVIALWHAKTPPMALGDWIERITPLTAQVIHDPAATEKTFASIAEAMARKIRAPKHAVPLNDLVAVTAERFNEQPWHMRARAAQAATTGDAASATRLRAEAMARGFSPKAWGWANGLLLEEFNDAMDRREFHAALGLAKAMFGHARHVEELTPAVNRAGQALIALGAGGEAVAPWIGMLTEGPGDLAGGMNSTAERAFKIWREATCSDAWREPLSRAMEALPVDATPLHWRNRVRLALIMGDGEAAWKAASTAYRLPDLSFEGQRATLDLLGQALRMRTGSVASGSVLAREQTAPSADGAVSIALAPFEESVGAERRLEEAWRLVRAAAFIHRSGTEMTNAIAGYAGGLALAGRPKESAAVMRTMAWWAPAPIEYERAASGLSSAFRGVDGNLARANGWLAFQRHGPVGPDGAPGTDDDLVDPLADVDWTLPAEWVAFWRERAEDAALAREWDEAFRFRLLEGDRVGAAVALRAARDSLPMDGESWQTHIRRVSILFRAIDGHVFGDGAMRAALFVRYGTAGPDGRPGTPDDLADPLASITR